MKAAIILAAAGIAVAQNFAGIPTCATSCLSSAITAAGCAPSDEACQCGTASASIAGLVAPCLESACSPADLISAASVGEGLCSSFEATHTGGAASATTTPSSTAAASSTTSGAKSTTSVPSSASSFSNSTTKSTTTTTSTKSSTSSTPSAATTAGAATAMIGTFGAVVAFIGAVAAL